VDIDVRLRMFTWFADVSGAVAVSRMGPDDISRARARRMSHNVVTSRVFGPMPRGVFVTDRVADTDIGPIPLRLYRPHTARALPVVVNFHGGGGTLGNLDQSDWLCAHVASRVGALVVSVDYRLAPEFRYPAGREDGYAAVTWVARHAAALGARTDRLAVMGDSAGGNLAAVVALMARDRRGPALALQVLIYPVIDFSFDTPSHDGTGEANVLQSDEVRYYWYEYLGDEADGANPYASPIRAESLASLPPALLVIAEYDPLRDEGEAYAARLAADGVRTVATRYDGMMHSFVTFTSLADAQRAVAEIGDALRDALQPDASP